MLLQPLSNIIHKALHVRGLIGWGVTIALAVLTWLDPAIFVRLDGAAMDAQFRLRGERDPGQDIVMVLVDEKSLMEVGRWPWSREIQAELLDRISEAGPKVIGLDVIYAESDDSRTGVSRSTETGRSSSDDRFAASIRSAGNVILAVPFFVPEADRSELSTGEGPSAPPYLESRAFMLAKKVGAADGLQPFRADAVLLPLEALARSAQSLGHVYRLPDHDGVTRRELLAVEYAGSYYPSFALEVARLFLGVPRQDAALSSPDGIVLGPTIVPTDRRGRAVINYAGRDHRFRSVSATDVLHGRVTPDALREKAVLVGTGALGTYDQLITPLSANFPGVEKNATVVENILRRHGLISGDWQHIAGVLLVLALGGVCSVVLPRLPALQGAAFVTILSLCVLGIVQFRFVTAHELIPAVMPLATIGSVFASVTVLSYALREQQAREIRSMFASYVSPQIVQELVSDPGKARLGGERKELTMLFADLVGFTTFSENRPAEDVVAQLNEYLAAMTEVIFKWNGTLDKFVGDEIVVFWGAPLEQRDHAELAVRCAVDMRQRLRVLQQQWRAKGKPVLENGIGINTGTVVVGNIGAEGKKMDYTVIGDHVNLAARLQGLTRTFGESILLTEHTVQRLEKSGGLRQGTLLSVRRLRTVTVKGRGEPVVAYAVDAGEPQVRANMPRPLAG